MAGSRSLKATMKESDVEADGNESSMNGDTKAVPCEVICMRRFENWTLLLVVDDDELAAQASKEGSAGRLKLKNEELKPLTPMIRANPMTSRR